MCASAATVVTHARRSRDSSTSRSLVLEAHDAGADPIRLIDRRIGIDRLRQDLDRARQISRPIDGHHDLLIESGGTGRKLLGALIAGLELKRGRRR